MADKKKWSEWLRVLHEYVENRWFLPKKTDTWESGGKKWNIGAWVSQQRIKHASGQLSLARVCLLELVPDWTWENAQNVRWRARLEELRGLIAAKGVPPKSTSLGRWAADQRSLRKKGCLRTERAQALESIPGWEWEPSPRPSRPPHKPAPTWAQMLDLLRDYAAANGCLPSPATMWPPRSPDAEGTGETGEYLGRWAARQRTAYNSGALPAERMAALDTVPGWSAAKK
jgi:hypothetical protein